MKRILIVAALAATLTPLSAHAQERMSDARYVAATRCLAYADLEQLQSDQMNFDDLRAATAIGGRERWVLSDARQEQRTVRARAGGLTAERLRERRDEACASFVEHGLVQLNGSSAS